MNTVEAQESNRLELPEALRWTGTLALPGALLAALRWTYELTYLPWTEGKLTPSSWVHSYLAQRFAILILLPSLILGCMFLLSFLAFGLARQSRRTPFPKRYWGLFAAMLACLCVFLVPEREWTLATIGIAGPGPHGADYFDSAASAGDRNMVDELLRMGVPIDAQGYMGTPLNAACAKNKVDMAHYLVSKGAEVNRARACYFIVGIWPGSEKRVQAPPARITVR